MYIVHSNLRWLSLAAVFILAACGGGGGDETPNTTGANNTGANAAVATANSTVPENVYTATLNATQETTASVSTASGIGVVILDPSRRLMRATLTTAGIAGASAHIQIGSAPTPAAIVFALTETPANSGIWSAQTTLTDDQLRSLQTGNFYFSLRSAGFSPSELRGQILRQLPASGSATSSGGTGSTTNTINDGSRGNFTIGSPGTSTSTSGSLTGGTLPGSSTTGTTIGSAGVGANAIGGNSTAGTTSLPGVTVRRSIFVNVLTGSQQIPSNASSATAIGVAIVDPANRTMVASITSLGISGTAAHIHQAQAGSSGDAIFALNETAVDSGIWAARLAVTDAQITALAGGRYYFDLHTAAFPNGELRGQIVASSGTGKLGIGSSGAQSGSNAVTTPSGSTATPFIPGFNEGSANTSTSTNIPASGTIGASVPTFGNPPGIGSGSGSGFTTTPSSGTTAIGTNTGTAVNTGSAGGFGTGATGRFLF